MPGISVLGRASQELTFTGVDVFHPKAPAPGGDAAGNRLSAPSGGQSLLTAEQLLGVDLDLAQQAILLETEGELQELCMSPPIASTLRIQTYDWLACIVPSGRKGAHFGAGTAPVPDEPSNHSKRGSGTKGRKVSLSQRIILPCVELGHSAGGRAELSAKLCQEH
jgi:hypothetical protein